jgi:hypothetical protein
MSKLVTLDDMITHLKLKKASGDVRYNIQRLLDAVEDNLARECNREFGAAATIVDEPHDGSGTKLAYTNKPIAVLNGIKLGRKKESTLTHNDADIVVYAIGSRKIVRTDGCVWPEGVRNVWLSYDAAADIPELAILAVKDVVALTFRRMGSEDSRSEKIGDHWQQMVLAIDESLWWSQAISLLHRPTLG